MSRRAVRRIRAIASAALATAVMLGAPVAADAMPGMSAATCAGPAGGNVLTSSLTVNGSANPNVEVVACHMAGGAIQVQVMTTATQQLDLSAFVSAADRLSITITLPDGTTSASMVTNGGVASFQRAGSVLTITGTPQAVSYYFNPLNPAEQCLVSQDGSANLCDYDAACEDVAAGWMGMVQVDAGITDTVQRAHATVLNGSWISTNAQAFSIGPDSSGGIAIQLAGPHQTAVRTPNIGTLRAFIPTATLTGVLSFLNAGAVTESTLDVIRREAGAASTLSADNFDVTQVDGGVLVTISGVHFSSPVYTLRNGSSASRSKAKAPRNLRATAKSKRTVRVSWKAPANAASAQITGYRVRLYRGSTLVDTKLTTGLSARFTKVRKGKYTVKVAAGNAVGYGPQAQVTVRVKK